MPGAEDTPPGKAPGGPKVLFGATETPRGHTGPSPAEGTPRVLFPADTAPVSQAAPDAGARRSPGVMFGSPQPPSPKGERPKVIADGVIRRRIACSAADLQPLDPAATPAVVKQALRFVAAINLDDAHYDDVLRFGAELQAEHGAIAEQELAFANAAALHQGQATLAQMIQRLGILDPETIFASRRSRFGAALRVLLEPARPPREVFAATYPELLSLAQGLRALEPPLVELLDGLRGLERRYAALVDGIAGRVLAANFVARFVRENPVADGRQGHYLSQADALETRATSLLATRATVELGRLTNETLRGNAQTLIEAGRGMLEEDLPAFHTVYTAALLAAARPPAGDPESGWLLPVRDVHARIMRKLKGDGT